MFRFKFFPIIIAFICFVLFETFFFYPKTIYACLFLINLSFLFFLQKLYKNKNIKKWKSYFALPFLFTTGSIFYLTMLESRILIQALFGLNIVFIYLYFESLIKLSEVLLPHKKLEEPKETSWDIKNISSYANFLSLFFISTAIYGIYSHLNIPIIWLLWIVWAVSILLVYNVFYNNFYLSHEENLVSKDIINLYIITYSLILTEFVYVISFCIFISCFYLVYIQKGKLP